MKSPDVRLKEHIWHALHGSKFHVHAWIRSLPNIPRLFILDQDPENLDESEISWIAYFRSLGKNWLTNYTDGGYSLRGYVYTDEHRRKCSNRKGWKHTPESRAKMSLSQIGNQNSKGYIPTPEKRRKISESNKGRKLTLEQRQNLSIAGKDRKHSEETKAKISAALKGHIHSEATKIKISQTKLQKSQKSLEVV